jgi:peptide/nickel transport system substrate-binding protein
MNMHLSAANLGFEWRRTGSILLVLATLLLTGCLGVTGTAGEPPPGLPATNEVILTIPAPTESVPATEPTASPPTIEPVATATDEPAPTPEPATLTLCTRSEPDTLFLYHGGMYGSRFVRELIYDGPIDSRGYDYQPVILEKLPSLADGDAAVRPVTVTAGDWVVDAAGERVQLAMGLSIYPAGCRDGSCAVVFQGEPLEMDQQTADFTLRPGIMWSDGTPLTAADSVYSYEVGRNVASPYEPALPVTAAGLVAARPNDPTPFTAAYEALDERTVRWTGLPGYFDPYFVLNFYSPLPLHQLGEIPYDQLPESEAATRFPTGWGAFTIKEWLPGDRIVAERNPYYFGAVGGRPHFDPVVVRFLTGTTDEGLAELRDGRCDMLSLDVLGFPYGQPVLEEVLALGNAGEIMVYPTLGAGAPAYEHLTFNLEPVAGRPPIFADARVRQAVAHCLDRPRMATDLTYGLAAVPHTYLPTLHPLLNRLEAPPYDYDPEAGRALLDGAGWPAGEDGQRRASGAAGIADNTPLIVTLLTTGGNELRMAMVERIAADLVECGIEIVPDFQSPSVVFADGPDGPLFGRDYDLALFAWLSEPASACLPFSSAEIPAPDNDWQGNNVGGYANPSFDEACLAIRSAAPHSNEQAAAQLAALRLFVEDVPALPLMSRVAMAVARPDLEGLVFDPTMPVETWNIENFRLDGE